MANTGVLTPAVLTILIHTLIGNAKGQTPDPDNEPAPTLRLINIIARHGDRAAASTFPSDPNKEDAWPQGFSQLSQTGIKQAYSMGNQLRDRYQDFLNATYITKEVRIESSDADRTLMSAAAALAGLYPPPPNQVWNTDLPWYPIPIHARNLLKDRVLNIMVDCPMREELQCQACATEWGQNFLKENQFWIRTIVNNTGFTDPIDVIAVFWDICTSELNHNLTWAPWITEELYEKSVELHIFHYKTWMFYPDLIQITVGRLLSLFIESMRRTSAFGTDSAPKLYLYSAHDVNMIALLEAVGVKYTGWDPYFASSLVLELHEEADGQFFIELWFFNNTADGPADRATPVPFPDCPSPCSLEDFLGLVSPLTVATDEEHERLCSLNQQTGYAIESRTLILVIICLAVVMTTVSAGMYCYRRKYCNNTPVYEKL